MSNLGRALGRLRAAIVFNSEAGKGAGQGNVRVQSRDLEEVLRDYAEMDAAARAAYARAQDSAALASSPVPVEAIPRGDWYGYDRCEGGKFVAGFLLDRDQEPDLREVARFNARGLAKPIGMLMAASLANRPADDGGREAALEVRARALVRQLEVVLHWLNGQAYSSTLSELNALKAALPPQPEGVKR